MKLPHKEMKNYDVIIKQNCTFPHTHHLCVCTCIPPKNRGMGTGNKKMHAKTIVGRGIGPHALCEL